MGLRVPFKGFGYGYGDEDICKPGTVRARCQLHGRGSATPPLMLRVWSSFYDKFRLYSTMFCYILLGSILFYYVLLYHAMSGFRV